VQASDGASCTNISDDSSEGRREGRHVRLIQQQHTRRATRAISVAAYAGLVLRRLEEAEFRVGSFLKIESEADK
jgi:hypothetical protein